MTDIQNNGGAGIFQQIQSLISNAYSSARQGIVNELSGEVAEAKEEYREFQDELEKAKAVGLTEIISLALLQLAVLALLIFVFQHYRKRYGWLVGAGSEVSEEEKATKAGYAALDEKEAIVPGEYPKEKL